MYLVYLYSLSTCIMKNPKTLIIALISSLLGSGISLIAEKPLSPPSIEGLDYVNPVPRLDLDQNSQSIQKVAIEGRLAGAIDFLK